MAGFTRLMRTVVLNPEEPDERLQNVIVLRKWSIAQRTRVASLSTNDLDVFDTQAAIEEKRPPKLAVNIFVKRLETLKACLVEWRGPLFRDEDGTPIPCTHEMIEEMDDDLFDTLANEADALVQGLSSAEKNGLARPTSSASSAAKTSPSPAGTPA